MKGSTTKRCTCPKYITDDNGNKIKKTCRRKHGSWTFQFDIHLTPAGRTTYGGKNGRVEVKIGGYETDDKASEAMRAALTLLAIPGPDDDRARVEIANSIRSSGREKRPFPTAEDMRRRYGISSVLDGKETVAQYLPRYVDRQEALGRLREGSAARYRAIYARFVPLIGHFRLVDLRAAHILEALTQIAAQPELAGPYSDQTVREYLVSWVERRYAAGEISRYTMYNYRSCVGRLLPWVGDVRLVDLDEPGVAAALATIAALPSARGRRTGYSVAGIHTMLSAALTAAVGEGLIPVNPLRRKRPISTQTLLDHFSVLKSALTAAVNEGLIPVNPAIASRASLPDHERRRPYEIDVMHIVRLLEYTRTHRLGPMVEMAVFCGLRRGELCGLRWEDIDFSRRLLTVKWQLNKRRELVRVKTRTSEGRKVGLDDEMIGTLLAIRVYQDMEKEEAGDAYEDRDFVFTGDSLGGPVTLQKASDGVSELIRDCEFPRRTTLHGLRHVCASLALDADIPLQTLSGMLGHSDVKVTTEIYGHLMAHAMNGVASRIRAVVPASTTSATIPRPIAPPPSVVSKPQRHKLPGQTVNTSAV